MMDAGRDTTSAVVEYAGTLIVSERIVADLVAACEVVQGKF